TRRGGYPSPRRPGTHKRGAYAPSASGRRRGRAPQLLQPTLGELEDARAGVRGVFRDVRVLAPRHVRKAQVLGDAARDVAVGGLQLSTHPVREELLQRVPRVLRAVELRVQ